MRALLHLAALGAAARPADTGDASKSASTYPPDVHTAQKGMIDHWQARNDARDATAVAAAEFSAGFRGDGWAYTAVPGVAHKERATWEPAGSEMVLPLALGRYMLSPYWGLFGGFNSAHRGLSAAGLMHAAQVAHLPVSGAGVSPVPLGTGSFERLAAEPGARGAPAPRRAPAPARAPARRATRAPPPQVRPRPRRARTPRASPRRRECWGRRARWRRSLRGARAPPGRSRARASRAATSWRRRGCHRRWMASGRSACR